MPSTTIHFSSDLLTSLDNVAKRRGISRNRLVVEACESAVLKDAGQWPENLFAPSLSEIVERLLTEASVELERAVTARRQNRGAALL